MMFIDEGFGSLDEHSRDQAVKVLQNMADKQAFEGLTGADLRKAYETLKKVHETKFIAGDNLKKSENTLKEEMAKHKNYYKKDGTTLDLAKVKMKLVKSAIEVNATGVDKIQQELDLQKEYQVDLKNISKGMVESFIGKKTAFDEVSNEIKDVKENLKTTMDTDIVEAIEIVVLSAVLAETEDESKPKKDKSEVEKLALEIKRKLNV
jgi:hypothetical protein